MGTGAREPGEEAPRWAATLPFPSRPLPSLRPHGLRHPDGTGQAGHPGPSHPDSGVLRWHFRDSLGRSPTPEGHWNPTWAHTLWPSVSPPVNGTIGGTWHGAQGAARWEPGRPRAPGALTSESSCLNIKGLFSSVIRRTRYKIERLSPPAPPPSPSAWTAARSSRQGRCPLLASGLEHGAAGAQHFLVEVTAAATPRGWGRGAGIRAEFHGSCRPHLVPRLYLEAGPWAQTEPVKTRPHCRRGPSPQGRVLGEGHPQREAARGSGERPEHGTRGVRGSRSRPPQPP